MKYTRYFVFLFSLIILSSSCNKEKNLVGKFEAEAFQDKAYAEWYNLNYNEYEIDVKSLEGFEIGEEYEILIFLGTWCGDSRREVPNFLKILKKINFDFSKLQLIGLDREKSAPGIDVEKWEIEFVPTIIFLANGEEKGRIIESPMQSLEEDMLSILSQESTE